MGLEAVLERRRPAHRALVTDDHIIVALHVYPGVRPAPRHTDRVEGVVLDHASGRTFLDVDVLGAGVTDGVPDHLVVVRGVRLATCIAAPVGDSRPQVDALAEAGGLHSGVLHQAVGYHVIAGKRPQMDAFLPDVVHVQTVDRHVAGTVEDHALGRLCHGEPLELPVARSQQVQGVATAGATAVEHSIARASQCDRCGFGTRDPDVEPSRARRRTAGLALGVDVLGVLARVATVGHGDRHPWPGGVERVYQACDVGHLHLRARGDRIQRGSGCHRRRWGSVLLIRVRGRRKRGLHAGCRPAQLEVRPEPVGSPGLVPIRFIRIRDQ